MDTALFQRMWQHSIEVVRRHVGRFGASPRRDWRMLVGGSAVLVFVTAVASVVLFLKVSAGEFAATAPQTQRTVESIDRTLLADTLKQFEEEESWFSALSVNAPAVVDPSR